MGWIEPHQKVGVAVCSPHRKVRLPDGRYMLETVTVEWHRARSTLSFPTNVVVVELFADGLEVGEARDGAARRCLAHDPRSEFLFFLDNDVLPDHDALTKLFAHARWRPDHDVFAGVYCCKYQNPSDPLIYAGDGAGGFWDWAVGDILTTETHGITSVHMGLTLIRTSVFQRLLDAGLVTDDPHVKPFFQTQVPERWRANGALRSRQGTEDIFFCQLLGKLDPPAKILVDTSCLAGHVDKNTGVIYGLHPDSPPVKRARWLTNKDREGTEWCDCVRKPVGVGSKTEPGEVWNPEGYAARLDCTVCRGSGKKSVKLALDLGAGGNRREWPGHKTYTLDVRPDAKPDYCQDTRKLNFPAGHWDLIASSHHLEHLGRWDQEQVWSEMFRVLKPGGRVEHIVPSLDWAANKVAEGEVDGYVIDVLYGAQEAHGYGRPLNTHYFGYTKSIARALAEQAGFVDVECRDWTDDPTRMYELTITGRKPEQAPTTAETTTGRQAHNGSAPAEKGDGVVPVGPPAAPPPGGPS